MYHLSTLDNGLRLVTVSMPHAYSISMGIYLAVGSRYEEPALAGASHFIEHLLFKGTTRRPTPREIALAIEGVGGDLNASTGREMTTYYARVSRDHLPIAADVLLDMLRHSRFEAADVERERQVITEEINETLDSPDDLAYIQMQELLWPDHPLGHDVAGSRESVRAISREGLLAYMARGYTPRRTVVAVAGAITHQEVEDLVAPLLGLWDGSQEFQALPAQPFRGPIARTLHRPVEQSHILLGTRAVDRTHPDRFALSLLNIILGEGMSSRLFVEIREELGLAYTVYSYVTAMNDTGSFTIYAGVDREQVEEALQAILAQLHRLREQPVSEEELRLAKSYARGRTLLRLEDSGANAGWVGGQLAMNQFIQTPDEVLELLERVTVADIQRVARDLLRDDALALSLVGPLDEDTDWQRHLRVE